ncbi:Arylsulfatase [Polystyrenella longa]|uniref:Arylsulfatase n=1 Tax=Polystyrenella longa TaxID=2528007 RepID=A0A518CKJ6_9PLAN|nr:sulfatase-like hydrolase/transferase [Polystyrenella longa]QDU79755.1 Arylsulfatase [Polystyrenella longa]
MLIRSLLLLGLFCWTSSANAAQPNVILIMADDIGYECYGCYGSQQYQTPNIDRLAEEGTRFKHCYSQPLCTPSRVKIMTGLSNARNYSAFSILNRDQRTFGHIMKEAGYRTFVGGKWQLYGAEHYISPQGHNAKGMLPEDAGFDQHCLWQIEKLGDRYWNPLLSINGDLKQFEPEDYGPGVVTDHILDFMDEESDKPFFVYYPMILVHNPFPTTPDSEDSRSEDAQQNFEDMVQYMDKLIGRIVQKTEAKGIAEETLIIVTGDNGTNPKIKSQLNGQTIKGGKGRTTDAGTRVALVAWQPGTVQAGKVCEDLVDFSDFVPTLQEVAGIPVNKNLDGISFAPALSGTNRNAREWMYCYYHPRPEREKWKPQRFTRDQRYKLYGNGRFYDIANDPLERSPLKEKNEAYEKLAAALESMPAESPALLQFPE